MNNIRRLSILLAEEAAEIGQAASKIARYGLDSYNPYDEKKTTNRQHLVQELGDLMLVAVAMQISNDEIWKAAVEKMHKIQRIQGKDYQEFFLNDGGAFIDFNDEGHSE